MPYTDLKFKPGINKEITPYSEENGWVDCDKVRFRFGYPEKLNGWEKNSTDTFLGLCRGLHEWVALNGESFLGVGTEQKYYIKQGTAYNDITPIRLTTSAGDVTFSATDGSSTITVTDTNHGCVANDFVTFSGAVSLGGNITANVLNQEYQVVSVIDSNSYTITARTVSTIQSITASGGLSQTEVTANSSDTGNGGGSVVGAYQIGTGLNSAVSGTGFGAGLMGGTNNNALQTTLNEGGTLSDSDTTITLTSTTGIVASDVILIGGTELILVGGVSSNDLTGCTRGHQGTTASSHADGSVVRLAFGNADSEHDFNGFGNGVATGIQDPTTNLRIWSHDNFGEDLIFCERNGNIYYWDKTNGVSTRAVELSTLSGTPRSVPQKAKQVLMSDVDRHVIAFGCDALGSPTDTQGDGVQDPMLIRFASQANPIDWYPTATNTADSLRIDSGSEIVQAVETRQQILVLTDTALYAMQYVGAPYQFNIGLISSNITIAGPNAAVAVGDSVYWMGKKEFYVYSGSSQRLPCTVRDFIFDDFNTSQEEQVFAGSNVSFGEIWWFYPSASATNNDRYVVYNYQENIWYVGTLDRTAWLDRGVSSLPVATGTDNYLFNHEVGAKADGQAMTSFIESGDLGLGEGNSFTFLTRVLPDLNFRETNVNNTSVDFIFSAKNAPGQTAQTTETDTVTKTSNTPVDQYTNQYQTRLRGRSFTFKVQSTDADVLWRLGIPRVDIRPDGRR